MKAIRVNAYLLPVLAVLALLGSVGLAKAAGVWQTSGRDEVMLDANGQPDPAGIKGWMTLSGVSETYGVPLETLYTMLGAGPELSPDTELKELEGLLPGMSVSTLRTGVAAYLDGSWSPADGPYGTDAPAPPAATPTPTPAPTAPPAVAAPTAAHAPQGGGTGEGLSLPTDGSRLPAFEIKGRMTLQEVVDYCQVPLDTLIAELGLPVDVDRQMALRDVADRYGIDVTAVRDVVSKYQAEH